jgi:hypothetical protein
MLAPYSGPPLPRILNHKYAPIKINRLIVAYHRPSNVEELLHPKVIALESGLPVSTLCDEMEEVRQQPPPTTTTITTANNNNRQQPPTTANNRQQPPTTTRER